MSPTSCQTAPPRTRRAAHSTPTARDGKPPPSSTSQATLPGADLANQARAQGQQDVGNDPESQRRQRIDREYAARQRLRRDGGLRPARIEIHEPDDPQIIIGTHPSDQ